jgi:hypothetical protein
VIYAYAQLLPLVCSHTALQLLYRLGRTSRRLAVSLKGSLITGRAWKAATSGQLRRLPQKGGQHSCDVDSECCAGRQQQEPLVGDGCHNTRIELAVEAVVT